MKITFIVLGKFKNDFVKQGFDEYAKRLSRFCNLDILELKDEKIRADEKRVKDIEAEKILKAASDKYLVLLDVVGKEYTSPKFAKFLSESKNAGRDLCFVVGGALGFGQAVLQKANLRISLSKMTFPHQLIRLIFIEQLYRGFMINAGTDYHKE